MARGVKGVTTGKIGAELKTIGLITKRGTGVPPVGQQQEHGRDGHATHGQDARATHGQDAHATEQINDAEDLAVTAGWGNPGRGGITMPAGGDARRREHAHDECQTPSGLGAETLDIYLNENVYWRNIPSAVWEYTLGGYQVIKKWLSYREHKMLGRPLRADEARHVTEMARRIAAILLTQPALDENYKQAKESGFAWPAATSMGGGDGRAG